MLGGGLGNYEPGEWSDDTQMAVCIARVTASGLDPTTEEALDAVAEGFLGWYADGPADIGNQTATVLSTAARAEGPVGARMTAASEEQARSGSAGNGALMRTGVVGFVALDDPHTTARVAARFAALTHADERCVDSCVLWSEAVRVAVTDGRLDVRAGLPLIPPDRHQDWADLLGEAETNPPGTFSRNGYTLTAFQAAWSAIHATRHLTGQDHIDAALQAAVAIGHDTDTVAAIVGALLGAVHGYAALPSELVGRVHGWPGLTSEDLVALALDTAASSRSTHDGR